MCGSGCPQFGFPRLRCVAGGANGFTMMASGRLQRSKPVAWLNPPSIRFHARTCRKSAAMPIHSGFTWASCASYVGRYTSSRALSGHLKSFWVTPEAVSARPQIK
jgi:hypothetical protein